MKGDRYADVAWWRPEPRWFGDHGFKGVIGYLCPHTVDATKEMAPDYVRACRAASLEVALVYETQADRPLQGAGAGRADALYAESRKDYPGVIIYACDTDLPWSRIHDYYEGVAQASTRPVALRGIYAGGDNCRMAKAQKLVGVGWLSLSTGWAGSHDLGGIDLHQVEGFSEYDANVALVDDWGQWREDDLTPAEAQMLKDVHDALPKLATFRNLSDFLEEPAQGGGLRPKLDRIEADLAAIKAKLGI